MTAMPKTAELELVATEPVPSPVSAASEQTQLALAETSPAAIMLQAMSRGATLEQIEKMMDLQERWERREAEKAFNEALAAFRGEALEVLKRKRVAFVTRDGDTTSYKHAELSDIVDVVSPALARHGFSYRWDVQQSEGWVTVTCILKHAKGHAEQVAMGGPPDNSGKKNSIQAIASTVTYLQRYTLKAITGIAEKGDDDDGQGGADSDAGQEQPADKVLDAGREAAMAGTVALTKWWGGLNRSDRNRLQREFGGLLKAARLADQEGKAHG